MNWINVKELAKYLKLSEMMIYKLAQNSEIPASKIGNSWRFSQAEVDKWLLDKSRKTPWLPNRVKVTVEEIIYDVKREFGENYCTTIIFGSFARGDADDDSDLDMLIVMKKIENYWEVKSKIERIAYSNTFEKNRSIVIAPVIMEESEFLTGNSPLIINIRKEGRKAA